MTILRGSAAAVLAAAALVLATGTPGLADPTPKRSPASRPAVTAHVIPRAAPPPHWVTPELRHRARVAADEGFAVPLPEDAHTPTTSLLFPGIRPGARMVWPAGCTLGFVFGTGADLSIGTAGHCAKLGEDVVIVSAPGVLLDIGTVVRSVADGIGNDFALIRLRPALHRYVAASVAYVGGPTGPTTPRPGDSVLHVGHGLVVGYGGTPRAGVVTYRDRTGFGWRGAAALGDSGSPVRLVDGRAAGGLTHVIAGPLDLPESVAGTTISRMQQIAGLPLATASALPKPGLPIPVSSG
jgi:hypothetical protein